MSFMTASRRLMHTSKMPRARSTLTAAWALLAAATAPAPADCLPMASARPLIRGGEIVPIMAAVRAAREAASGEMIDGRLCEVSGGYQYVVTFLGSDGRVVRVSVDARTGRVAGVR
jgi:uncharacterized membrane protein YkoI